VSNRTVFYAESRHPSTASRHLHIRKYCEQNN
jgi:hypothetical protein